MWVHGNAVADRNEAGKHGAHTLSLTAAAMARAMDTAPRSLSSLATAAWACGCALREQGEEIKLSCPLP